MRAEINVDLGGRGGMVNHATQMLKSSVEKERLRFSAALRWNHTFARSAAPVRHDFR